MKKLLPLIFIAIFSLSIFAQQQPLGFAGTWMLDDDSTFDREIDRKACRDYLMVITDDTESFLIKVSYKLDKRPVSYELKLFKDGRGETNTYDTRVSEVSETTATDRKITRKYTRDGPRPGDRWKVEGVDEFMLSKDGSKLIRRRTPDAGNTSPASRMPGVREILPPASLPPTLVLRRKS